jgi:hypothetical protein
MRRNRVRHAGRLVVPSNAVIFQTARQQPARNFFKTSYEYGNRFNTVAVFFISSFWMPVKLLPHCTHASKRHALLKKLK